MSRIKCDHNHVTVFSKEATGVFYNVKKKYRFLHMHIYSLNINSGSFVSLFEIPVHTKETQ